MAIHHLPQSNKKKRKNPNFFLSTAATARPDPKHHIFSLNRSSAESSSLATVSPLSVCASPSKPSRPLFAIRQPPQVVCHSCVAVEAQSRCLPGIRRASSVVVRSQCTLAVCHATRASCILRAPSHAHTFVELHQPPASHSQATTASQPSRQTFCEPQPCF